MSFEDFEHPDWPELLAAFVDGELTDRERAEVEARLAADPNARDLLQDQREFSPSNRRLWRALRPEEPAEHVWRLTQSRVEAELRDPVPFAELAEPDVLPIRRKRRGRWLFTGGGVAAVVALMVGLPGQPPVEQSSDPVPVVRADADEPAPKEPAFVFATDDDVEIVSISDADTDLLLVGTPPLPDPMRWATGTDVVLEWAQPDEQGRTPDMAVPDDPSGPMVMNLTPTNPPDPADIGE